MIKLLFSNNLEVSKTTAFQKTYIMLILLVLTLSFGWMTELIMSIFFNLYDLFNQVGKLTYGNSDPDSSNYNSLADFCYGKDFVEIRIPWQLLNFSNPTDMKIHDDYYEQYGVEEITISKLYIGVSELNQKNPTKMVSVNLNGWYDKTNYHERLKKSYFILKKYWRK